MTAEKYVKQITKRIYCDKNRKIDIQKQLLSEINERILAGEKLQDIISEMGDVAEVANSFNESISISARGKGKKKAIIFTVIGLCLALGIVIALICFNRSVTRDEKIASTPEKVGNYENNSNMERTEVETAINEIIDCLDKSDYSKLQSRADAQMAKVLNEKDMKAAKASISNNFGNRKNIESITYQDVIQNNNKYTVCQAYVDYENVSVIYTISFDTNKKLAGLYMK